jgi:hypothetical protein
VLHHQIWVHQVERTAVVLGSTQRFETGSGPSAGVSLERAFALTDGTGGPVELCRRRSGGGLVVVDPTASLWVDIIVPTWSPLHHDDLARSFRWFGRIWQEVLAEEFQRVRRPGGSPAVHTVEPDRRRRARDRPFHCFAEPGHGEVTVEGRKVVGLSQRRTRSWSRLQSLALLRWNGEAVNQILAPLLELAEQGTLGRRPYDANEVLAGLDPEQPVLDRSRLLNGLVRRLPALPNPETSTPGGRPDGPIQRRPGP